MSTHAVTSSLAAVASQVLDPSWEGELEGMSGAFAPATASARVPWLTHVEAAAHDVRHARWREKRTLRANDFEEIYSRRPPGAFAMLFAEADPDP